MAIELMIEERKRQDEKWGDNDIKYADFIWSAILTEETGEVAHEVLNSELYCLRDEVVQVAAVAIAWLEAIIERENE